ncbi:hypothetical protein BU17DRAFT_69103 [Hysterangium stoloniferum]|nr:hypothetical protein BU17DRAFT_69103 [Hysterangium stoloniferum]
MVNRTTKVPTLQPFHNGNISSHPTNKNLRYKPYPSRTSRPHSTQDYGPSSSRSKLSEYNGDKTDTDDIGLATAPVAACSNNSDNDSSHTALPSLPAPPRHIQSLRDGIAKQAKKNHGSNYGERDSSISGLSEGKEGASKATSVSPSTAEGPSDLSHGDPMTSLIAEFSDMKLRPKTLQDNKQRPTIRDTARTHTMRPSFSVRLLHHKGKVKHPYSSKKDAILGGDAKRHSSIVTLSALCHQKIILGRELSSRSLRAFGRLSQSDTGSDQLALDTKTELTGKKGEDTGSDISACLGSLSKLDINSGKKVHEKDVRKKVPLHRVLLPTKSALRTTGAKAASPYEKATSQPHGCIPTRLSSVRDGTISLNDLTLLSRLDVEEGAQDVEMADAFEAPFEGYLRPAGLPTWLTDYGYSWYLRMLNHVGQDVEMDADHMGCRATSYYVPVEDYQKKSVVHIDWASGPIFGFGHEVVRSFIQTSRALYIYLNTSLVANIDEVVTRQSNLSIMQMTSLLFRGQEALDRILPVSVKSSFSLTSFVVTNSSSCLIILLIFLQSVIQLVANNVLWLSTIITT